MAQRRLLEVILKGQSNEIFILNFFSFFECAWANDQWVKIFFILVKILWSYSNFRLKIWLAGEWYPGEPRFGGFFSDSPGEWYPRGDWLTRVSYPWEIGLPGYSTQGRLTRHHMNNSRIVNILTHWSGAQVGSNYEEKKTGGRKSRWTVPLNTIFVMFLTMTLWRLLVDWALIILLAHF